MLSLRDRGILLPECKETAVILFFFDRLIDSVNGSFEKRKRHRKPLFGAATQTFIHYQLWKESKKMLLKMKYIHKHSGKEELVPILKTVLDCVLAEGQVKSLRNRRVCMRRTMRVEEAREVCKERTCWNSVLSAYPARELA